MEAESDSLSLHHLSDLELRPYFLIAIMKKTHSFRCVLLVAVMLV